MVDEASSAGVIDTPVSSLNQSVLMAAKGSGIKFFGIAIAYLMRFALGILMARFMGAEQYGLYSLADTTFYMLVGLSMLGLVPALVRYIPVFINLRDEKSLWGTLQIGIGIPFVISGVVGAGLLVFAKPFAQLVFHDPRLVPVLWVVAFALPFGALISATSAAMRGFKKIQYSVIVEDISFPLIKLVIVVGLISIGMSAVKAMIAHAIGAVICSFLMLYFLHKLFPLVRPWNTACRKVREMFRFSLPIYGSRLLHLFGTNVQTFLLGALNTIASVGIFTVASRINLVGVMTYQAVTTAAEPIVSDLYSKGAYEQLGRFYQNMTKWIFMSNLPIFFIILFFSDPILSVFGEDFVAGSTVLVILSCGNLANAATGINSTMISMTGNTWLNVVNTVLSITMRTVLSLLLIPRFGAVGAAMTLTCMAFVYNLVCVLEVFILLRLLPYDRTFIKPIIAGAVSAVVTYATSQLFPIANSLIGTLLGVSFLSVLYIAVVLLLGLSEEDRVVLVHLGQRMKAMLPK